MSKRPSKYIGPFGYIDKILIVLSARSGGLYIISFASVIGIAGGISCASITIVISLTRGIIKRVLYLTRNKMKNAY